VAAKEVENYIDSLHFFSKKLKEKKMWADVINKTCKEKKPII
jgi:hypothetical protein